MLGLGNIFRAKREPEENPLEQEVKKLNEEIVALREHVEGAENEIVVLNLTNKKLKEEIFFKDNLVNNLSKEYDVAKKRYFKIDDFLKAVRNLLTQDI
jgi:hypothetical protein